MEKPIVSESEKLFTVEICSYSSNNSPICKIVSTVSTDQPVDALRKFIEKQKGEMSLEKILDNATNVASAYIQNKVGWRQILRVYPTDIERL